MKGRGVPALDPLKNVPNNRKDHINGEATSIYMWQFSQGPEMLIRHPYYQFGYILVIGFVSFCFDLISLRYRFGFGRFCFVSRFTDSPCVTNPILVCWVRDFHYPKCIIFRCSILSTGTLYARFLVIQMHVHDFQYTRFMIFNTSGAWFFSLQYTGYAIFSM